MGPDTSITNIVDISPVGIVQVGSSAVSHQAVVFLLAVDLDQPAPIQVTLCPRIKPGVSHIREKVLVTCLGKKMMSLYKFVIFSLLTSHCKSIHSERVPSKPSVFKMSIEIRVIKSMIEGFCSSIE